MSKVFSFTEDYQYPIRSENIVKGGSGYDITLKDGKEVYTKGKDLIYPIEHIMPDYSLYDITDTAYGFMTRGCPRGCDFCIVNKKEGRGETVAPLEEFWSGQKNIVLLDPNPLGVKEWRENFQQLIDSKAYVDFNQGVDIRLMTEEKAEYIKKMKIKYIHFAWDRYEDNAIPKLKMFREVTGWGKQKMVVYVLVNFNTTLEQDLERIYKLRELGYAPYVMIYNKDSLPKFHILRKLQRYVNRREIFFTTPRFEDYSRLTEEQKHGL